jgi:voltage-gated sodium channel
MMGKIRAFVESRIFTRFVFVVIILNTAVLGMETSHAIMSRMGRVLIVANLVFTAVYVAEMLLKLTVYRLRYFRDGWNIFDFVIVVSCLIPAGGVFGGVRVLRLLRALRVLRMVSGLKPLRKIVSAIIGSLPGIGWSAMLMLLLYYVYAIIGIHMFAVDWPERFGGFPAAFLTLFELTTLEGWSDMVKPICAAMPAAWIYFLSAMAITSFILLNLVVGIIVDSIGEISKADDNAASENSCPGGTRDVLLAELDALEMRLDRMRRLVEQDVDGKDAEEQPSGDTA